MSEAVRTMMRMDAEAAQETPAQADAGFLWDFWYPAARSTEIRGQKLVTAMLLEVPLVLGRTSEGKVFAMRDSCPHRGIPLSYGRLDGKVVECCYHGWRFDACSGQCVEIPSLSSQDKLKVERIFAGHCGFQRQIQSHAPFVRAAFAHRSWDYRIDGPGAWAVCAPIVVLAEAREHSRESQAIRADSERIPDEPAFAEHEQRAVPVAEKDYRRAGDDDDRFCAAECPHGD